MTTKLWLLIHYYLLARSKSSFACSISRTYFCIASLKASALANLVSSSETVLCVAACCFSNLSCTLQLSSTNNDNSVDVSVNAKTFLTTSIHAIFFLYVITIDLLVQSFRTSSTKHKCLLSDHTFSTDG